MICSFKTRWVSAAFVCSFTLLSACRETSPEPQPRPNVLLVVMDTVAASHLSVYGYEKETSPNLARLAQQGALYLNAFGISAWTLPNHASLFTGLYSPQHGATYEHTVLDEQHPTLAGTLSEHGYHTLGFSNNGWVGPYTRLHRGFDQFTLLGASGGNKQYTVTELNRTSDGYETKKTKVDRIHGDQGAQRTNAMIDRVLDSRGEDSRPFFLFVNYIEAHMPYAPPKPFARKFLPDGVSLRQARQTPQGSLKHDAGVFELSEGDLDNLRALYDAEIAYVDQVVGDLVASLDRRGILDETVVLITSDHGEQIGDHGFLGHNLNLYDRLLHVPLIVRYPKKWTPGTRVQGRVQSLDLHATILELAIGNEARSDSSHAQPLPLDDSVTDRARPFFANYYRPVHRLEAYASQWPQTDMTRYDRRLHTLRMGPYKLIAASDGSMELFDVERDPGETQNLATERPEDLRALQAHLSRWLRRAGPAKGPGQRPVMDEDTRENLRQLGYIK